MNFGKSKTKAIFAAFLVLTFAVTLVALPAANAHTPPWTVSTYAYIAVEPNPVGVGQTAYVSFWIDKVPPTAEGWWGYKWHNMTVTVTKPDGSTVTLGPFDSDAVGGTWTQFVPETTGTYKFVGNFPAQTVKVENPYPYPHTRDLGDAYVNDTFTASSATTTLTVQQEPIETAYPFIPLPSGYWQRPINSMNRNWYSLGGNWYGLGVTSFGATGQYDASNGNFNPYTTAPNSAHVLWTKPMAFGGQIGGEFGDSETGLYASGTAYEAKFGAVVLYGILYYTSYPGAGNNPGPLTAVDLRTGKTLWTVNTPSNLRCGMVYNFISGDQYGAHAYLFTVPAMMGFAVPPNSTLWSMWDAMTGQWVLDIANVTVGTLVEGENGELLSYRVAGGKLTLWNSSLCIANASQRLVVRTFYSAEETWRPPQGATIDFSPGNQWTVPIATQLGGNPLSLGVSKVSDGVVLLTQSAPAVPGGHTEGWRVDAGYSAVDGHLLWGPINRTQTPWTGVGLGPAREGVYTEYYRQGLTMTGYSLKTGEKLWTTVPFNNTWIYYNYNIGSIGYGTLFAWGLGGEVYAFDLKTGALKWSWSAGSAGVDTPYGVWPLGTWPNHYVLADGKLYVRSGHDYTPPVFRGAKIYCINATSGDLIWSSLSFDVVSSPVVADGIMVWYNGYDDQIYAYGKGQTATTVEAPMTSITAGDTAVIHGTVTDQSPGQTCLGVPAAGTPAIADESMSAWMEYMYQQQAMPTNAKGVTVTLDAVDPNNNFVHIGTVTSDTSSNFGYAWTTPNVPGKYTIIATFEGSESYYASYAETYAFVSEAPAATPTPTPAVDTTPTIIGTGVGTGIAIIIAVAIVGILLLRKRP
jgi:hypothetical protein